MDASRMKPSVPATRRLHCVGHVAVKFVASAVTQAGAA